jgi:hypothetical protein
VIKKLVIIYSFIITTIMALTGFLGATTYQELFSAVLFYPLAAYFWFLIMPRRSRAIVMPGTEMVVDVKGVNKQGEPLKLKKEPETEGEIKISGKLDKDRRMFLKLIGSAGLSVFMLSIFTKRAQAAFFGSIPGPGTVALKDSNDVVIDPAKHHPTDGYNINQLDDSTPAYYGFTDKDGNWFIMREDASGNYRYTRGGTDFTTNWTNRATLSYDYFDVIF